MSWFFSVLLMGQFKNVGFHILLCLSCSSPHSWRHFLTLPLWPVILLSSLSFVLSAIQSSGRKRQNSPVKTNIFCTVDSGTHKGVGIALWDRFHQPWLLSHHNLSWTGWLNGTGNCFALPGRRTKKEKQQQLARSSPVYLKGKDTGGTSCHVHSMGMAQLPSKFVWCCFQTSGRYAAKPAARLAPPSNTYIGERRWGALETPYLNKAVRAGCVEGWDVAALWSGRPLAHLDNPSASAFDLTPHQCPSGWAKAAQVSYSRCNPFRTNSQKQLLWMLLSRDLCNNNTNDTS